MTDIWQALQSGRWLTASRIRGYSLIVLALGVMAIVVLVTLADRLIDRNGKPIGTDFSNVYAAGRLTWQGQPQNAYDPVLQYQAEQTVFDGRSVLFYGWHYPPFFF